MEPVFIFYFSNNDVLNKKSPPLNQIHHLTKFGLASSTSQAFLDVCLCDASFQVFVELNELTMDKNQEMQWKETARWIKFEEDVEEETDRWGKPHVASLSFRSLLELRKTISHGRGEKHMCRRGEKKNKTK